MWADGTMSKPLRSFYLPGLDPETRRRFGLTISALNAGSAQGTLADVEVYAGQDMVLRGEVLARFMAEELGITNPKFEDDFETKSDFVVLVSPPKAVGA